MRVSVIRNNLPLGFNGHIPNVAVMANLGQGKEGKNYLNLFIANPENIPDIPHEIEMGYTFDQLTCPPDFAPASDLERVDNNGKIFSTQLDLLPDEILPWTWPDGRWKVKWLIDQGIATETGKFHMLASYPIPILKLTPDFFRDCMNAMPVGRQ